MGLQWFYDYALDWLDFAMVLHASKSRKGGPWNRHPAFITLLSEVPMVVALRTMT